MAITPKFLPQIYVNQHKVLEIIYNSPSVNSFPSIQEIVNTLNLSEKDVVQASYLLKGRGFAFIRKDRQPYVVGCTPDGEQALLQKLLLEEGKEKAKANFLRWTQIAGIIIASTISIGTFIMNTITTARNSKKIELLTNQIEQLRKK